MIEVDTLIPQNYRSEPFGLIYKILISRNAALAAPIGANSVNIPISEYATPSSFPENKTYSLRNIHAPTVFFVCLLVLDN